MPFGLSVAQIAPRIEDLSGAGIAVRQGDGAVVEAILTEAEAKRASLIAIRVAGPHGFLVALRRGTSEHTVHNAPHFPLAQLA